MEYQAEVNETFVTGEYPRPSAGFVTVTCTGGTDTSYSISTSAPLPFDIDPSTGELNVTEDLDYDTGTTSYSFGVICFEGYSPSINDTATVRITILPVNEFRPVVMGLTSIFALVPEDTPVGTVIVSNSINAPPGTLETFTVTDDDAFPDNILTFTSDNINTMFLALNTTQSYITLIRVLDLDDPIDPASSITVSLTACDFFPPIPTCPNFDVRVFPSGVNEFPPLFSQDSYSASISEGVPQGTEVLVTECTDSDLGVGQFGGIEFFNPSQEVMDAFTIDSSSGNITTIALNYDAVPTYSFMVRCFDTGGLEDLTSVIVNIVPLPCK